MSETYEQRLVEERNSLREELAGLAKRYRILSRVVDRDSETLAVEMPVQELVACVEDLRQRAEAGWRGLANIYKIVTGEECADEVALGMETSAVDGLSRRFKNMRQLKESAEATKLKGII